MKPEVLSAVAACIAVLMAFVSWYYNRETSKGMLSLYDVKVSGNREKPDTCKIQFLFLFRNIGHHPLLVKKLQLGHYDFTRKVFQNVSKPLVVNDIYPESVFNYSTSFVLQVSPEVSDEQLSEQLPKLAGDHSLILIVQYEVKSLFSFGTRTLKSFFGYDGHGAVYQLTIDQYRDMEGTIPDEFKK